MTPVGILVPQSDELFLACVTSKVTSDCLVDVLEQWWQSVRARCEHIRTLVINLDNGPENQSHRTQFLNRLVAFAQTSQLTVTLAYYPPYHSKYNPVERCWGILENHWNGDVLDTCGDRGQVCPDDDLERQPPSGTVAHHHLSHRRSLKQEGHGRSGNARSALDRS